MAGVTIVPDPNVTGEVYADLRGVPLETALDIMLAGSPFIVKTTPDYYLVADRSAANPAFADITQTRSGLAELHFAGQCDGAFARELCAVCQDRHRSQWPDRIGNRAAADGRPYCGRPQTIGHASATRAA